MNKVLLLNASYEPLNICSWQRAVALMHKGKAEEVEYQDFMINSTMPAPSVIKLRYYVAVPYKELPFNRKNILERDDYTCQYCGKKTHKLTLDHVHPKSKGGEYSWENIVAACPKCNQKKADRTPEEAGMKLKRNPFKPQNYYRFEIEKQAPDNMPDWGKYIAG